MTANAAYIAELTRARQMTTGFLQTRLRYLTNRQWSKTPMELRELRAIKSVLDSRTALMPKGIAEQVRGF